MTTTNFYLLINQHGERYVHYKSPDGEKLIDVFDKIPYTPDSLLEDILDGFSSFPWQKERTDDLLTDYEYNDSGELIGLSEPCLNLGEEMIYRIYFDKLVHVMFTDDVIYTEFHTSKMREGEKHLFEGLLDRIKEYCTEHHMNLETCDETYESVG